MTRKTIGVGLIGLGLISRAHLKGYEQVYPDARIVAVCDNNETVLKAIGKHLGARAYVNHYELLNDPEVNVVDVMLPHNIHYQVAKDAISSGRHVIVEKPITVTSEEALELIQLAKANDITFTVAENTPFVAAYQEAEKLIEGRILGDIRLIRTFIYGSEVERLRNTANWKGRR